MKRDEPWGKFKHSGAVRAWAAFPDRRIPAGVPGSRGADVEHQRDLFTGIYGAL